MPEQKNSFYPIQCPHAFPQATTKKNAAAAKKQEAFAEAHARSKRRLHRCNAFPATKRGKRGRGVLINQARDLFTQGLA